MRLVGLFALLAMAVAACGAESTADDQPTVFAASSLTDAFTEIAAAYEADHPEADVTLSFASSSDLARQIVEGAPADVFVSADLANMQKVVDAGGAVDEPQVFATNRAEIIVAPGNPLGITGVTDLADPDLVLVVCAPEVPCGTYADAVFESAGIEVTPDSLEENVKAVVGKVTLGEADAGVVYATDVLAAGDDAAGVEIPADINIVAEYPIVATTAAADDFIAFVVGPVGQRILASYGFGAP